MSEAWDKFIVVPNTSIIRQWEEDGALFRVVRGIETFMPGRFPSGNNALVVQGYYPPIEKHGQSLLDLQGKEPEEVEPVISQAVDYMLYKFKGLEASKGREP